MRLGRFAQAAHGLEAVHLRHLAVHQHDIEACLGQRIERLLAVGRECHLATEVLQHHARQLLVDRVVLGQQHAGAAERARRRRVAGGAPRQHRSQRLHQFLSTYRLGEEGIDAAGRRDARFRAARDRGQQQYTEAAEQRLASQPRGQGQAVHHRHLHVDHGRVERPAAARRRQQPLDPLATVLGRADVHAGTRQLLLQDAAIGRVVLDHHHAPSLQQRGHSRRRHRRVLTDLQPQLEAERRALALSAADLDTPTHQLDQLLADGQAEPGAAVAARHRLVGLHEGGKQARQLVRSDADAGVAHLEGDATGALRPCAARLHAGRPGGWNWPAARAGW